jgi:hypothetical protein
MKTPIQNLMDKLIKSKKISVQNMIDITPFLLDANKEFKQNIIDACIKTTQDCWISNANLFGLDLEFTDQDLIDQKEEAEQYYKETYN